MREWQVGDPVGDGNDIGVPDIPYMGYLRDDDEEEDLVDEFKSDINNAKNFFDIKDYGSAFTFIKLAFRLYGKLNKHEKSQLRDQPFNQYWIIDLCCKTINKHDNQYQNAAEIIIQHNLPIYFCADCCCAYPTDYDYCIECGKEF